MNTTRTATRTRITAAAAALAGLALTLTACGGGGTNADGTYYSKDVNGTSDLGQLVVNGKTITHHEYGCKGVDNNPRVTSTGEFNEDRTQVTWTVAGEDSRNTRTGTEPVAITDSSISLSSQVYVIDNSDTGKSLMESFKAKCNN